MVTLSIFFYSGSGVIEPKCKSEVGSELYTEPFTDLETLGVAKKGDIYLCVITGGSR